MKDLEIRGAGNLLGGQQSGHIEGVGFDLYVRMVGEAVAAYRGEKQTEPVEMRIELPVDAHLPTDYIQHERLRLEAYRKMAAASTEQELTDVLSELSDRYGPVPEPVHILADVARLRMRAKASGVHEILTQGRMIRFSPIELADWQVVRLGRLYPKAQIKTAIRAILVPAPLDGKGMRAQPLTGRAIVQWVRQFLDAMAPLPEADTGVAAGAETETDTVAKPALSTGADT